MHLLIIERDTLLNSILSNHLTECGYRVDSCFDLLDGMAYTKSGDYDCIIADTEMPISCVLLLDALNIRLSSSAILLLTDADLTEPTNNQYSGIIDCLTKPFTFEKLLLKIELLIQKNQKHNQTLLQANDLIMNTLKHTVTRNNTPIPLTDMEFALLEYLLVHKGKILSREQISKEVWHSISSPCSNNVDVYVRYLRNKIDKNFETKLIQTIRGTGYTIK